MNISNSSSIDLLKAVKMFTAAYETASFSAAGRQLGLTPGAVSKQIGMLESLLGCRLFQRTTRNLSITEEGRRLYALVQQPAQQIADAIESLSSADTGASGTVKVSLPIAFTRVTLLPLLSKFREKFELITLDLRFENRHVDLISEGYDCAIGNLPDMDTNVVARKLSPSLQVLCAAPSYLERHGEPHSMEELERHELISFRSPSSGRIQAWKLQAMDKEVTFQPHSRIVVTDTEALAEVAVAGCGVVLLGAHHAFPLIDAGKLKHVMKGFIERRTDICIYYPTRKYLPPRVALFVEFVIEELRQSEIVKRSERLLSHPMS
ncbi:LysR family transcriptional regulator [Dyella silvatica]|uniref:LysR family transcriptional regulator n=1 Tax=Dyella silvatica TaxID=2992128 RepID=UPI0022531E14|nr:LysR family transcriptional regulator [Dyella silvatica]